MIHATDGTAALLKEAGIAVKRLNKLAQGRPNVVDMIKNGEMQFIINTPSGKQPRQDEVVIRSTAVANRIPIMTTLRAAAASAAAIASIAQSPLTVTSLQEQHAQAVSIFKTATRFHRVAHTSSHRHLCANVHRPGRW